MEKELQQKLMENFNEKNIENVDKLMKEPMPEKVMVMVLDESGNGKAPNITEESRKICAESLLR